MKSLVVVALIVAGCAEAQGPAPGSAAPDSPVRDQILRVVPTTAEVVLLVDLAQLRASPWTSDLLSSAVAGDPDARIAERGFDELRDVDQLVLAALPSSTPTAAEATESLVAMRGRIDADGAFRAARKRWPGAVSSSFRGRPLLSNGPLAVAFATDEVFVSGPLAHVRAAIDCVSGKGADVRAAAWLGDLRRALMIDPVRRPRGPAVELAVRVTSEIRERIDRELGKGMDLRTFAARLDLRKSLDLALVGSAQSGQQAVDIAARLTEQTQALQSRRSLEALGLDAILGGLWFRARGARLEGALSVSEDQRLTVGEKMKAFAQLMSGRSTKETP